MNKLKINFIITLIALITLILAACAVDSKYEIKFMVDGEVYYSAGSDGNSVSMPSDPEKEGYVFDGWYFDDGVWEKPFSVQLLLDVSLTTENYINVYAKFNDTNSFGVQFTGFSEENGKYVRHVSKSASQIDLSECISVDGDTTYEISLSEDFSSVLTSQTVSISADENLFYVKVKNEYEKEKVYKLLIIRNSQYIVSFDTGCLTQIESQSVDEGGFAIDPNVKLYKNGSIFVGWDYDFNNPVTDDIVITAIWANNSYEIVFDAAGGNGTMQRIVVGVDQVVTLPDSEFTRKGYEFVGWTYANEKFSAGQQVSNLSTHGTVTMTAEWRLYEFTLRYDGNGQTSGRGYEEYVTYESKITAQYSLFKKTGYTSASWRTDSGVEIKQGKSIYIDELIGDADIPEKGGALVLYAVWEPITYTVRYRSSGTSRSQIEQAVYDEEFALIECPPFFEKQGYVFSAWRIWNVGDFEPGDTVKNLTITMGEQVDIEVVWKPISYTIGFDLQGGECAALEDYKAQYDEVIRFSGAEPVKEGYTFVGYQYNEIFLGKSGNGKSNLTDIDGDIITVRALYEYNYSGEGTEQSPYILDTTESVSALSEFMLLASVAGKTENLNAHFKVSGDIDMQGAEISPACVSDCFTGTIDGGMFTISNFSIVGGLKGSNEKYIGFIGKCDGTIKNLFFENVTIDIQSSVNSVGTFAAECYGGKIENCQAENVDIDIANQSGNQLYVGGLVGYAGSSQLYGNFLMSGCKFDGNIVVDANGVASLYFGGGIAVTDSDLPLGGRYLFIKLEGQIINAQNVYGGNYLISDETLSSIGIINMIIEGSGEISVTDDEYLSNVVYIGKSSSLIVAKGGASSNYLSGALLADDANLKDFEWVTQNVYGFNNAKWYFDGENYPYVSQNASQAQPKAISSVEELKALEGKKVGGSYYLACDIDLGGAEWVPFDFYGCLDGRGHTISNFVISSPTADQTAGFISYNYGEIKSLSLTNCTIIITEDKFSTDIYYLYAGALAAYNYGTIKFVRADCLIDVATPVDASLKNAYIRAGGLVAYNEGNIYSCYADADITANTYSGATVGGLVGVGARGEIVNCYTTGAISGFVEDKNYHGASGGGIVGSCSGQSGYSVIVKNSFSVCNINLVGNQNFSQVNCVAKYTENCYSSAAQSIIYCGEQLNFTSASIVDGSKFENALYLTTKLKFGNYVDEDTLEVDYSAAWVIEDGKLPKLYFEM